MAQGSYELGEQGGMVRDPDGRLVVSNVTGQTVAIAAGTATDTVVKASSGTLLRLLVTAAGATALQVFDNASGHTGTVIAALAANAPIGVYTFGMPAVNGITVLGDAGNPAVTVAFV